MDRSVNDANRDASLVVRAAPPPEQRRALRAGAANLDPEQAKEVARWRKAERERLIGARASLAAQNRQAQAQIIARQLALIIETSGIVAPSVGLYWPVRGEPDLRPWMHALIRAGLRVALPVPVAPDRRLEFHEWRPGDRLVRGLWSIPHPEGGKVITPHVLITPMVGFDSQGYRLGYGGEFYGRTLAELNAKPLIVGVGYSDAELRTIVPQPEDLAMDWVVTGSGSLYAHV